MPIYKKYVDMIVRYYPDGTIKPMAIWWEEGMIFEIDKIVDVRPCASLKAGGAGYEKDNIMESKNNKPLI
jgi:hypothetical protein